MSYVQVIKIPFHMQLFKQVFLLKVQIPYKLLDIVSLTFSVA